MAKQVVIKVEGVPSDAPAFSPAAPYVVTLSGDSGTLKTSVATIVQKALGSPPLVSAGEQVRQRIKQFTDDELIGPVPSKFRDDKSIDTAQIDLMHSTIKAGETLLLESRLGGYLAKELLPPELQRYVISILIISRHEQKRMHRIHKRYIKTFPDLSLDQVTQLSQQRSKDDIWHWRALYQHLRQFASPFDQKLTTTNGHGVYDLVLIIDHQKDAYDISSGITKYNMARTILEYLRARSGV